MIKRNLLGSKMEEICTCLGYQFRESSLLNLALTHRSASKENNERLEFLGDSILNFIIAEALHKKYPKLKEGEMSRLRADLVNRQALIDIAHQFNLGKYIILGSGEYKSGGQQRESILANTVEALIGAIYLDSSFETCRQRVISWYQDKIENLDPAEIIKDPKTRLQEYLQAQQMQLPTYRILAITGKDHEQIFKVACEVEGSPIKAEAKSTSRRKGERLAAENFYEQLIRKK